MAVVRLTGHDLPANAALEITHMRATSAEHVDAERSLLAAGIAVPMSQRADAIAALGDSGVYIVARNHQRSLGAVFIQQRQIRALPGYALWRIHDVGDALPAPAREPILRYALRLLREDSRVVRFNIGVFSRESSTRLEWSRVLAALGFVRTEANTYTRTLAIDLRPTEAELLNSFSSSVRKRLKEFSRLKVPVEVKPVTDATLANRMNALMGETMARTGGRFVPLDWERRILLANKNPSLCRIVGVFHRDLTGDARLLAFAYGCHHGTHAQYSDGASARQLGRMPLMYPLLWDLIRWARDTGAHWFDMGGVTAGTFGDGQDPLGGISDFKRRFSDTAVEVAEEWVLESRSVIATAAIKLNRMLHAVRSLDLFARRARPTQHAPAVGT